MLRCSRFLVFLISYTTIALAQIPCPSGVVSDKLVCLIPNIYGVNGLVVANPANPGNFQTNFLSTSFRPLDSAIARQLALLPTASPSSGITLSWDEKAKIFISSTDSYGPILSERSDTIGRHLLFVGFDYQYFQFHSIDGLSLKNLPVVFTQPDFNISTITCSLNSPDTSPARTGNCSFIRDVITTANRLDLKVHQFTSFITFGITNRIDVSLAIPIENIHMSISSAATINRNENPTSKDHAFPPRADCPATCLFSVFSSAGTASGVGDMTLRIKGVAWKGERASLALGADVRFPTGDSLNFLGGGAYGLKPFMVWSYRSNRRISPHAFSGYETNGSSIIAGDILTGTKDRLPSRWIYSGGADVWITTRITAAFDLVGEQVFQARRTSVGSFIEPGACNNFGCQAPAPPRIDQNLSQFTGSYNTTNASIGGKIRPAAGLLLTGNVLLKLNDGGLRATAVPLVGVSYTF